MTLSKAALPSRGNDLYFYLKLAAAFGAAHAVLPLLVADAELRLAVRAFEVFIFLALSEFFDLEHEPIFYRIPNFLEPPVFKAAHIYIP